MMKFHIRVPRGCHPGKRVTADLTCSISKDTEYSPFKKGVSNNRLTDKEYKKMSKWGNEKGMRFDMPASYRIEIQGYLDASWSDRLAGMHISKCLTRINRK